MADVEPLLALHYDLAKVGGLQPVAAPPYDVIDAAQRAVFTMRDEDEIGDDAFHLIEEELDWLEMAAGGKDG